MSVPPTKSGILVEAFARQVAELLHKEYSLQEFFAVDAQAWRNVCPPGLSAVRWNATGLAQVVIVAEADTQGGTGEGANGALKQQRPLYVRQADDTSLPGNKALIELGAIPLQWPLENSEEVLVPLLEESETLQQKQKDSPVHPDQSLLFAASNE